jgi:hypothetical protein
MATMKKSCPPGQHMVNGICTPKPFSSIGSKIGLGIPVAGAIGITAKMITDKVKAKKAKREEEKKKKEAEEAAKEMPTQRRGGATKKYMTGGMVNANAKVSALTKAGSNGVKSGVNPKAKASTTAKGRTGGTSKAPKGAKPTKNKRG